MRGLRLPETCLSLLTKSWILLVGVLCAGVIRCRVELRARILRFVILRLLLLLLLLLVLLLLVLVLVLLVLLVLLLLLLPPPPPLMPRARSLSSLRVRWVCGRPSAQSMSACVRSQVFSLSPYT